MQEKERALPNTKHTLTLTLTLTLSLFFWNASAQLHHQMLSSQGSTSVTSSGVIVTQTIGQTSVIGNSNNSYSKIGQGYQQANWARIIVEGTTPKFKVLIYPNPFNEIVTVQHNSTEDINITVFNPSGKLVLRRRLDISDPSQTVNFKKLPAGIYLIHLQSNKLNYFTKLIKK